MSQRTAAIPSAEPLHHTRSEIEALLQETRWRILQASHEEQRLQTELRAADLELRLGEAWTHRAEGRTEQALKLLPELRREATLIPNQRERFKAEIDLLERKLAIPRARQEIKELLADAANHCRSGKPSVAKGPLERVKHRLLELPNEGTYDLYQEFMCLYDHYQSMRDSALERFTTLRESVKTKIAFRVGDVCRLSRANHPLQQEVLENLQNQVSVAQGILTSLDPDLIGREDHEAVGRALGDLRGALTDLLQECTRAHGELSSGGAERIPAAASPPASPSPSPAVVLSAVSSAIGSPPTPSKPPEKRLVLELSPWAMGSWGASPG